MTQVNHPVPTISGLRHGTDRPVGARRVLLVVLVLAVGGPWSGWREPAVGLGR